jgi:hypothetical protein
MKAASDRTKQCKKLHRLFTILHFLCLFGPFLYYIPQAFILGTVVKKVTFSLILIVTLCLSAFAIFIDAKNRAGLSKSIMWLLIIGVSSCLAEIKAFIYIMAIVSILDEICFLKLRKKYKIALISNKEIDRRQ